MSRPRSQAHNTAPLLPYWSDLRYGRGGPFRRVRVGCVKPQEQALGIRGRLDAHVELYENGAPTEEQGTIATRGLRARFGDVQAQVAVAERHPVASRLLGPGPVRQRWEELTVMERRDVVGMLVEVRLLPSGKRFLVDPSTVATVTRFGLGPWSRLWCVSACPTRGVEPGDDRGRPGSMLVPGRPSGCRASTR